MAKRKERIPDWYISGSLKKTTKYVLSLIEKGHSNEVIAAKVSEKSPSGVAVSKQAMHAFVGKKIRKDLLEFLDSLPDDHIAVQKRRNRVSWLVNNSRVDTNNFIKNCIESGWKRKEMVKAINAMAEGTVDEAKLNNYIQKHIHINGKKPPYCPKLAKENRFFSVHIMGATPEALDRWRERCTA